MLTLNQIHNIDCIEGLKLLKKQGIKINCCVTSPPYYGLRDYGINPSKWPAIEYVPLTGSTSIIVPDWTGCLGLEPTIEMYIGHIVFIFRLVKETLEKDGTFWLNIGDSYAGSGKNAGNKKPHPKAVKSLEHLGDVVKMKIPKGLKAKDLILIPSRIALALQADGWWVRSDIVWNKPNAMPESVTDRPSRSHEYIFLLTKSSKYFFDMDSIKEPCTQDEFADGFRGGSYCNNETFDNAAGGKRKRSGNVSRKYGNDIERPGSHIGNSIPWEGNMRNKRDVWNIATKAFPEAHFATFPPDLIQPCILGGCPAGGTVLDPFMGSGTVMMKAWELQRNAIGFELNSSYIRIAESSRLNNVQMQII